MLYFWYNDLMSASPESQSPPPPSFDEQFETASARWRMLEKPTEKALEVETKQGHDDEPGSIKIEILDVIPYAGKFLCITKDWHHEHWGNDWYDYERPSFHLLESADDLTGVIPLAYQKQFHDNYVGRFSMRLLENKFNLGNRHISPTKRRQGHGKKLLHIAEKFTKNEADRREEEIILQVDTAQTDVMNWAEKNNFKLARAYRFVFDEEGNFDLEDLNSKDIREKIRNRDESFVYDVTIEGSPNYAIPKESIDKIDQNSLDTSVDHMIRLQYHKTFTPPEKVIDDTKEQVDDVIDENDNNGEE